MAISFIFPNFNSNKTQRNPRLETITKLHEKIFFSSDKKHTFVIGDTHGEFDTLKKLVQKLPRDSRVIFVGDLVDRGKKTRELIKFIRENNFESVLGNHDALILELSKYYARNGYKKTANTYSAFLKRGGFRTLSSYGICKKNGIELKEKEFLSDFWDDMNWIENLPIYKELDIFRNELPVVISHAPLGDYWEKRWDYDYIKKIALWNRENPSEQASIFNIFGHTPQKEVLITKNFVNVDTGCCYGRKLSAFCVETGKVISVEKI